MKITVAATQFACSTDAASNLASAERVTRAAAARGAQVVLLQELFETPYFCKDHLAAHFQKFFFRHLSSMGSKYRDAGP